jgi:Putative beta barrel porin-7 (BBP7)
MKIKTLHLVLAALTFVLGTPAAWSQDFGDAMLTRLVSWVTGDCSVMNGPSCGAGPACGAPSCGAAPSCEAACAAPLDYAEDTCCADGCCGCCNMCCRTLDTWGSVEFLMWWGKGTPLPPLVTTSPQGTIRDQAGVLGFPNTSVLFGDQLGGNKLQGGGRVTFGLWLDPDHNVTAGGRFFGLGGDTTRFSQASTGDPILARPFFNSQLNRQDSLLSAFPGLFQGGVNAHLTTNNIIGAEAFTEIMMVRDTLRRVDLVAGYQFFRMDDWLQIDSNSTLTQAGNPLAGLRVDVSDRFSTRNQFHGGEVGLRGRMARGLWSINVLGQIGLGNMNEQVTIAGTTTTTSPIGGSSTTGRGLLAQPSNIGTFERNKFVFIPQLIANLNYHVTPNLSFHIGYNFLWISDVALSGEQTDLNVNLGQPVGPNRPRFVFRDQDYWLQGINWGMNWDF